MLQYTQFITGTTWIGGFGLQSGNGGELDELCLSTEWAFFGPSVSLVAVSVFWSCGSLGSLASLVSLGLGFPFGFLGSLLVFGPLCSSRFLPVPRFFFGFSVRSWFAGSLVFSVLWFLGLFFLPLFV